FASCGNEVQWWICEDVRVGFSLFNCPDLRCYVPQASGQLRSDYQDVDNQEMTEEDLKQALAGVSYKIMAARNSIPRIPHDSL
uniref:Uncharacterized protein n=2 Tax=Plectus sambesii TaxID=2011161 RepID=A0A914W531_9BILA